MRSLQLIRSVSCLYRPQPWRSPVRTCCIRHSHRIQPAGAPGTDVRLIVHLFAPALFPGCASCQLSKHSYCRYASNCNSVPAQVEVYTFGSPRVGNSTFAADYDKRVPETWHVINDRDTVLLSCHTTLLDCADSPCLSCHTLLGRCAVSHQHGASSDLCSPSVLQITQVGKFRVYKRTGQSVIVNPLGDVIVRPAPLEQRLHFNSQCAQTAANTSAQQTSPTNMLPSVHVIGQLTV